MFNANIIYLDLHMSVHNSDFLQCGHQTRKIFREFVSAKDSTCSLKQLCMLIRFSFQVSHPLELKIL
jgi:hypothetical protein